MELSLGICSLLVARGSISMVGQSMLVLLTSVAVGDGIVSIY